MRFPTTHNDSIDLVCLVKPSKVMIATIPFTIYEWTALALIIHRPRIFFYRIAICDCDSKSS